MSKQVKPAPRLPVWLIIGVIVALVLIVGGVILAVTANQSSSYTPEVVGAPSAVVDEPVVDHGTVKMEETVESSYRIRNVGDQALLILGEPRVELVTGCCPPRALVSSSTVRPGQEATITLRYTMHDMMGGPHEFRVHVLTNDPDQPEILLTALSNWVE